MTWHLRSGVNSGHDDSIRNLNDMGSLKNLEEKSRFHCTTTINSTMMMNIDRESRVINAELLFGRK